MPESAGRWLVLVDGAGEYYLLDPRLLEEGRVPPERRETIDRLLVAGDTFTSLDPVEPPVPCGVLRSLGVVQIRTE
jgi:hypothetical protein